ncbi:MAG: hypothetical protein HN356_01265 [Calditrichaeota bacterium]|nr:hypothetical protein [Calditrichota bacterium]MBT7789956.1 hypothetical protein [Calditrichota bacterium]
MTSKKSDDILTSFWNLLKSMRFALILLLIITAASIFNLFAGEFVIPTDGGAEGARAAFTATYGDFRVELLMLFQMYAPYSSWWFISLLVLLSLSLIVCVIERTPKVYKLAFKPRYLQTPEQFERLALNKSFNADVTADKLKPMLNKLGFTVWIAEEDSLTLIDAEKFSWARTGSWFVHVGFILLIIGAAMISRADFRSQASGFPGEMLAHDETHWGFNVRVDDFQIEYYPLGPGQWVQLDGYQFAKVLKANQDSTFDIETSGTEVEIIRNVKAERLTNKIDYRYDNSRIDQGNISDYIATLTVVENGRDVFTDRVEVNHPLRHKGYRFYQSSFNDRRTDEQGRWTTVLSIRKDKGSPFVWVGIIIVSIGLLIGMYFVPRRVYLMLDGNKIYIGGTASRNKELFKDEFYKLIKGIRALR